MCLVRGSIFSNEAMKPGGLQDQLDRMHPNKIGSEFKKLRDEKAKQATFRSLFTQTNKRQKYGPIASYKISNVIAKTAKPLTVGEALVFPAVKEIIETVLQQNVSSILRAVPLKQ